MKDQLADWLSQYDIDEFDKDKLNMVATYFFGGDGTDIFSSDEIDVANEEVYFLVIKENVDLNKIQDQINKKISLISSDIKKFLIFEVSQEPVASHEKSAEDIREIKIFIQQKLSEYLNKHFFLRDILYTSTVITQIPDKKDIYITIDSRIKSLEQEIQISDHVKLQGYVFSASLKDILKLYNTLGNTLFEKNLRFNIGEQLGVNESIKKTIEQDYEKFWFLNNGISLFINDADQVDFSIYDKIKIVIQKGKLPSIINGAQTITASSKALIGEKDPYVLLRLFIFSKNSDSLDSDSNREIDKSLDEITVALNRQKPIKTDDIAYTYSFVSECNNLSLADEYEKYNFKFARRGEVESILSCRYTLVNFARIVKAYLANSPGSARSNGANTLLKGARESDSTDIVKFKDETIFKDLSEENAEQVFLKYYKPVNFAFKLKKLLTDSFLEKISEGVKNELGKDVDELSRDDLDALSKFGRYFLIATYIHKINGFTEIDFLNWNYVNILSDKSSEQMDDTVSSLSVEQELKIIYKDFLSFRIRTSSNKKEELLDANTFKKNDLFHDFLEFYKSKD